MEPEEKVKLDCIRSGLNSEGDGPITAQNFKYEDRDFSRAQMTWGRLSTGRSSPLTQKCAMGRWCKGLAGQSSKDGLPWRGKLCSTNAGGREGYAHLGKKGQVPSVGYQLRNPQSQEGQPAWHNGEGAVCSLM